MVPGGRGGQDGSMTTFADAAAGTARRHTRWPALLLPLVAAGFYAPFHPRLCWWLIPLTAAMAGLMPRLTAKLAPFALFALFALFAYGAYGIFLSHALSLWDVLKDGYGPGYPLGCARGRF
jgi:hypothetical protein